MDFDAYEYLYRQSYRDLCGFIVYLTSAPLPKIQPIVEGILANVWNDRASWSPYTTVRAHLYREARTAAIALLPINSRRRRSKEQRIPAAPEIGAAQPILARLPERLLTAWLLFRYSGLSDREVADVMRTSPNEARAYVARVERMIRSEIPGYLDSEAE
jgi:RNA polymerase sigma-70 factor, ECF subfamily